MIDIENIVITQLNNALTPKSLTISSEDLPSDAKFPYIYAIEGDNYIKTSAMDSSNEEFATNVMYEVKIYSNKASGKKIEAKEFAEIIDTAMREMGFLRTTRLPQFLNNGSIFCYILRYKGIVDKNNNIHWR